MGEELDSQTISSVTDPDGLYQFTVLSESSTSTSLALDIYPPLYDMVGPVTLNFNGLADAAGNQVSSVQITSTISSTPTEVDIFSSASVEHILPNTIIITTLESVTGTPDYYNFEVSGKTVQNVEVSNAFIRVTIEEDVVLSDSLTVTYYGGSGDIQNSQGHYARSFYEQP